MLSAFAPVRLPAANDVGEVVYQVPHTPGSYVNRREIRRFLKAYGQVYLPWLMPRPTSDFGSK